MLLRFLLLFQLLTICLFATGQFIHPNYRQYTLRDGLSQMQVINIMQDSRGYIWAGTKQGLNCLNGEKIISYTKKDGLLNDYISGIVEDNSGNIWFATRKELACFDGQKVTSFPFKDEMSIHLLITPDKKIWCAGTNNLKNVVFGYFESGKFTDKSDVLPFKKGNLLFRYSLAENAFILSNHKFLFEYKNNKLLQLMKADGEFDIAENDSNIIVYEHYNRGLYKIWEYRHNNMVYAGYFENKEYKVVNPVLKEYTFINYFEKQVMFLGPDGMRRENYSNHEISDCLIDRDNRLWLGTEEGLLQVFQGGFETYKREYLPVIWSVIEDPEKNMWFASYNFGLIKFDGKAFTHFPEEILKKYALNFYFQPQINKNGMMYFPNNLGLFYTNGKKSGAIKPGPCLAAFYDKRKDLMYGGYHRKVEVYNIKNQLVKVIDENGGLEFKGYISSFGQDSSGYIWMGGFSGLARYNPVNGEVINYNSDNGKLPSDGILSIFTDFTGSTWFGSTSGLLRYNQKTDSIFKTVEEDIPGSVNFVTAIDSSWLVFSQSAGVYLMNLQEYYRTGKAELRFFNEQNGFMGIDPGQNGALTDSKGNIWMTTSTEVVKLDPRKLKFQNNFRGVRFARFNNQILPFNTGMVELPRNERSAVFTFDVICFNRPVPVEYSWKIEDGNSAWSDWKHEKYAVIANFADGKSKVLVRARVPGLPGTYAESSVLVKVSVAFWKQPWFFPMLFGLFAFFALLAFIMFIRTRTRMAETARQAKIFQVQAIQSQMNPHFIFNVLASFQTMILSSSIEKANDYLVKLADLIRGFLDASSGSFNLQHQQKPEKGQTLQKELEMINSFVEFQLLIYPEKFDYIVETDPAIDIENETIPPMLIQPFIENAIRHGLLLKQGKGILKLAIKRIGTLGFEIIISDNGIGIKKAGEILKESPFRYESKGTILTINRIKLLNDLGLPVSIQSESSGEGTTIKIKIQPDEK